MDTPVPTPERTKTISRALGSMRVIPQPRATASTGGV